MKISHNTTAIRAYTNLAKTDTRLSASMSKLSSGYKINKASDDPSGMAISQKMQAQLRALDRANNNAGDGISLVQTAEGSLNEVHSIVSRIRELTVQAASNTYGTEDIDTINEEIGQLTAEIDKISRDTNYNGRGLLDGMTQRRTYPDDSAKGVEITDISDAVGFGKYDMMVDSIGTYTEATTTLGAVGAGTITINGLSVDISATDTIDEAYEKLRATCDRVDIDLVNNGGALTLTSKYAGDDQDIVVKSSSTLLDGASLAVTKGTDAKVTLGAGYNDTATTTIVGNEVTITDSHGFEINMTIDDTLATAGTKVTHTVLTAGQAVIQIGSEEGQTLNITIPKMDAKNLGLDKINVYTHALAAKSLDSIDEAIKQVSAVRSKLGAYQNRMEHTISNLEVATENMTTAVSRIMDTDMATEMSEYTQQNVLSQTGVSMLAKANTRPENLLQLLQ